MLNQGSFPSILSQAENSFGRSFDTVIFHAFDENQMPTGAPLSAMQYIEWLATTYATQSVEMLRSITAQYTSAIESAKNSPGILPEALANLIVSGAVFEALLHDVAHNKPAAIAQAIEKEGGSTQQVATLNEAENDQLKLLRDNALQALHLKDDATLEEAATQIETLVQQHAAEIAMNSRLSEEARRQDIKNYQARLRQHLFTLRSIEARLGNTKSLAEPRHADTPPIAPNTQHLSQLKAQEEKLLQESQELEKNVASVSSNSQHLQHIKTQIQIVEQLLQIIKEETAEEKM
ncbi:MAG: hypothetical protein KIH62_000960 [Candidatus Kerfeldbacteria bacterium]|nr:hypothetical protein [Candidatus Kerfeldbacteria bacterium]